MKKKHELTYEDFLRINTQINEDNYHLDSDEQVEKYAKDQYSEYRWALRRNEGSTVHLQALVDYIEDDENSIRPEYREFLDILFESLTIPVID